MLIDNINLNLLRVFDAVCRTRSMTKAAEQLHMTQSGVSQNIKTLEEVLQVKLFDRVKQKPVPTQNALELYAFSSGALVSLEKVFNQISTQEMLLRGTVKLGLPIEFGNNVVLPLLAKWAKQHPQVDFQIQYDLAPRMNNALLNGDLDFAIVDEFRFDPQVESTPVAYETLTLCASRDYMKGREMQKNDKRFFESLDYIDYTEEAPILDQWFKHHYHFGYFRPNMRASLMDVQGMAKMISEGMGAGILPLHVIKKNKRQRELLYLFEGSGKPLLNHLSLVSLKKRTHSLVVLETLQFLKKELLRRKA